MNVPTKELPYSFVVDESDLQVGTTKEPLPIFSVGPRTKWLYLRNISTNGANIRVGTQSVSMAAPARGIVLRPWDDPVIIPAYDNNGANPVLAISHAIADRPGAVLNYFVMGTSG